MTTECPRELEVLECVIAGRWPDGCAEELRAHAASCAVCADLVAVSSAISGEMHAELREVAVPSSGTVWWRMQRRRRAETARQATRVITLVQAASVMAALAFAMTILGGIAALSETWRTWLARMSDVIHFGGGMPLLSLSAPLLVALAATLLLAPVAVYLAVAKD